MSIGKKILPLQGTIDDTKLPGEATRNTRNACKPFGARWGCLQRLPDSLSGGLATLSPTTPRPLSALRASDLGRLKGALPR